MRSHKIFFISALYFLIGIGARSVISFDIFYLFVLALLGFVLAIIFWSKEKSRLLLLGAFFLFFGAWRLEAALPKLTADYLVFYADKIVELTGRIDREPDQTEKYVKIVLADLELNDEGVLKPVVGKILVNAPKYGQEFNYGQTVFIRCEIEKPGKIKAKDPDRRDFDYGHYLKGQGVVMVCYQPFAINSRGITQNAARNFESKVDLLSNAERAYTNLLKMKQKFKTVIDENMSLRESGLLSAMILGYRREILPDLNNAFATTGLTHIIAISGLNITLIAALLFELLGIFGLTRAKSFWLSMLILFFYVLMIGAFASAARAFIMSFIYMYSLKIGRPAKAWNLILLAAVILLLINPLALMFDIGFQLSFLAILGLMIFQPIFSGWFEFVSDKFKIRSMLAMTLSAQVFTLPLIAYYFGRISLIAPLANLLVLPTLPVLTTIGFLMILSGLVWSQLAFTLGLILHFIVWYIIFVAELLSQVPYASIQL